MTPKDPFDEYGIRKPGRSIPAMFREAYKRQYEEAKVLRELCLPEGKRLKLQKYLLADDVGCGKTWVGMMTLFSKLHNRAANTANTSALVVVPTRMLCSKWVRELETFRRQYVRNASSYAIETVSSTTELMNRLYGLNGKGGKSKKRKFINFITQSDAQSGAYCFMLHVLSVYAEVNYWKSGSEAERKYANLLENLDQLFNPEEKKIFSAMGRFISQAEACSLIRFLQWLKQFRKEKKDEKWITEPVRPHEIRNYFESLRKKTRRVLPKTLFKCLIGEVPLGESIEASSFGREIAGHFLARAAETLPYLELYRKGILTTEMLPGEEPSPFKTDAEILNWLKRRMEDGNFSALQGLLNRDFARMG